MDAEAAAALRRAKPWVAGCQNEDGGFVFHRWRPHPGNKAKWNDEAREQAVSYGTPTCDGLRCLMAVGFSADGDRAGAARQWLARHPQVKRVPGFESHAKRHHVGRRVAPTITTSHKQSCCATCRPPLPAAAKRHWVNFSPQHRSPTAASRTNNRGCSKTTRYWPRASPWWHWAKSRSERVVEISALCRWTRGHR